jgi:hypothetical protein
MLDASRTNLVSIKQAITEREPKAEQRAAKKAVKVAQFSSLAG